MNPPILNPATSYSFSQYGNIPFDTADILSEFGITLQTATLHLIEKIPIDPAPLARELEENIALVDPSSEIARREALIFPVLRAVCKHIQSPLKIEYAIQVDNQKATSTTSFPRPETSSLSKRKTPTSAKVSRSSPSNSSPSIAGSTHPAIASTAQSPPATPGNSACSIAPKSASKKTSTPTASPTTCRKFWGFCLASRSIALTKRPE
ncbi:MAG: hypothetical protein ACFB9N_08995 [Geitlerinemataceae cyanobacterium]